MRNKKKTNKPGFTPKVTKKKDYDKSQPPPRYRIIKRLIYNWKAKQSHRTLLINMELINGFHKHFIILEKEDGFDYRKKKYLFDEDMKYYDLSSQLWCYDYHESLSLPLKRVIPVNEIKTILENDPRVEVAFSINPSTIKRFQTSKIAEGIMRGQSIDDFFKKVIVFLAITVILTIINTLIGLKTIGLF